ncbi:MAG: alkylhydroperoxidase-related (seleno)protein [Actinomycetota bacterium]
MTSSAGFYDDAPVPVRADLADAHRDTFESWASAGNYWTGAERLAIAAEVRRARAADELPPWVGPSTVEGLVADDHVLPAAAVDAVWRLTNHSSTMSAAVYEAFVADGLDPARYAELVGVVATANCIEVFADSLGIDSRPLPEPMAGDPDPSDAPTDVAVTTHWVPTAPGQRGNVVRALSSVPVAMRDWLRLSDAQYVPIPAVGGDLTWSRGAIDRRQVELLAARTSLLNECFY